MIELLERPINSEEGHAAGNTRREHDLAVLIASLTPVTALALQRRLDRAAADDPLVRALRRLSAERRNRVYARLVANRKHKRTT